MWDFKLLFIDFFFYLNFYLSTFFFKLSNFVDPYTIGGLVVTNLKFFYQFTQNTVIFFGIKFLLAVAFLILIRGGTPRYRYDYLTKLGWLRFIGLVLLVFFLSLMLFYIF